MVLRVLYRKAGILIGFVPLIVYGVLAGSSVSSVTRALAAAFVITIFVGYADLRKGLVLSWANLVIFGCALVAIGILGMDGIIPYMGILIYAALAAVTFGSILARKPFTLQYARGMVDMALWKNPRFIRLNVLMSGIWGGIFLVNLGLSAAALVAPGSAGHVAQVATYFVLVAGIAFTIWFPEHMRKTSAPAATQDTM